MIELLWNNPIAEARMEKYAAALNLRSDQYVLDVGCGAGELLIRLHEQYGVSGLGIDSSDVHIAEANRRAALRNALSNVQFETADAASIEFKRESCDAIICMGSSHAFGLGSDAYANALTKMRPLLKSNGSLLVGEGYMRQPACMEYRELLGDVPSDDATHASNVESATQLGFVTIGAWTSSLEEWDDFEWGYQQIVEQKAASGDDAAQKKLAFRRKWMDAYLRWGRDTMGFGVYLLRKSTT